jgi:cytochrome c oxidase subunit 2
MNELVQILNNLMREMLFLPAQASTFADQGGLLHYFVVTVTMLSSRVVGLLAIFFFFKYRETKRDASTPIVTRAALRGRHHLGAAHLLPRLGVDRLQGLPLVHTTPKNAMDVYVTARSGCGTSRIPRPERQRRAHRARQHDPSASS